MQNPYMLFVGIAVLMFFWAAYINVRQLRSWGRKPTLFTMILLILGSGCLLAVLHDAQVIS